MDDDGRKLVQMILGLTGAEAKSVLIMLVHQYPQAVRQAVQDQQEAR